MTCGPAGFHRVEFAYAHGFFEKGRNKPIYSQGIKNMGLVVCSGFIWVGFYLGSPTCTADRVWAKSRTELINPSRSCTPTPNEFLTTEESSLRALLPSRTWNSLYLRQSQQWGIIWNFHRNLQISASQIVVHHTSPPVYSTFSLFTCLHQKSVEITGLGLPQRNIRLIL